MFVNVPERHVVSLFVGVVQPSDDKVQNGFLPGSILKLLKEVWAIPLDVDTCARTLEGRCQDPHSTVVDEEAGRSILALGDVVSIGVEV